MLPETVYKNSKIDELYYRLNEYRDKKPIKSIYKGDNCLEPVDEINSFFVKLEALSYDEDYPKREAFENIICAMDNPDFNFVYMITGEYDRIEMHLGVIKNTKEITKLNSVDYGKSLLANFTGNFSGSKLSNRLTKEAYESEIINKFKEYKRIGVISGVPSINEYDNKGRDFQGIDRLINGMAGISTNNSKITQSPRWRLMIICEPFNDVNIIDLQEKLYDLYNFLHSISKATLSDNLSTTLQQGDNVSVSNGYSTMTGRQEGGSKGGGHSSNSGNNSNWNENWGTNSSKNNSYTSQTGRSKSESLSLQNGASREIINKKVQEILKYIDDELLERVKLGYSKGLFNTSTYIMADRKDNYDRLKSLVTALFQGNKSQFSPLVCREIDDNELGIEIVNSFKTQYESDLYNKAFCLLHGINGKAHGVSLSTLLTTKEISLLAGMPQKEVIGIALNKGVDFGLNIDNYTDESQMIKLGNIIQRGAEKRNCPFFLSKETLMKHVFIAGVTGSGKTTTCQKLLSEANIPFLVIEPAKTEYRSLSKMPGMEDVIVFTMGNELSVPFRINPFELVKGENITSHVDMLKATFTTAFPMEASMPQILEESIYRCYENKGWNVLTNKNKYTDNPWGDNGYYFPIMSDLISIFKTVVAEKEFGDKMEAEYLGSLRSRLSNLLVGSKGAMLNCPKSINFDELIERKVIIEMEELKSAEDKALIMGFILSRIAAMVKLKHNQYKKENRKFQHVTLIEEAHRLLAKVEYGDSGVKKTAVEMFTDMLAEVRKYGEGLIIVDQIPNKLAVEVLKNTNTKIIQRLYAKDDKEIIGDTMLMDDDQKEYLSSLKVGQAIIFTESTQKPIHVQIDNEGIDTSDNEVEEDDLINQWHRNKGSLFFNIEETNNLMDLYDCHIEVWKKLSKNHLFDESTDGTNKNNDLWDDYQDRLKRLAEKTAMSEKIIWRRLSLKYLNETGTITLRIRHLDAMLDEINIIFDCLWAGKGKEILSTKYYIFR